VVDGIKELLEALELGVYDDSIRNREKYGNYSLTGIEELLNND
jgi:hypothetical protein